MVGPVPVPCTGALAHFRPRADLVGISPAAANALRMNSTHTGWWDLSRSCTPAEMSAVERAAEAFAQQVHVCVYVCVCVHVCLCVHMCVYMCARVSQESTAGKGMWLDNQDGFSPLNCKCRPFGPP